MKKWKKCKVNAYLTLLVALVALAVAGCAAGENSSSQSQLGLGLYTGRAGEGKVEIMIAGEIDFPGETGSRVFKLAPGTGQLPPPNTEIIFRCVKDESNQWEIKEFKKLNVPGFAGRYNLFNAKEINEGDKVMGLEVVSVSTWDAPKLNDYGAIVEFKGDVTLNGRYMHHDNDEILGHEISFQVDGESAALLPRLEHDERTPWLIFSNHDEAEKLLGSPGSGGKVTVVVENFVINYAPATECWNTAELVTVQE